MILGASEVVTLLAFPLILLLASTLIAGWARRRDEHRRALEVKTHLVSDMSEYVIAFVTAVRFAVRDEATQSLEYEHDYRAWENHRAVLGTKLEAYFPDTNMQRHWRAFVEHGMREYFEITQERDRTKRQSRADDLQTSLIELRRSYRCERLLKMNRRRRQQQDMDDWENDHVKPFKRTGDTFDEIEERLRRSILDCKGELIRMVMEWPLDGLEQPSVWEHLRRIWRRPAPAARETGPRSG
jgi:hypothetical protein